MIKFKEFSVGDADYKEQMEQFQTEHQNAEFVQITGGHMSYEKIWFKYEPSDISSTTDKLSVEKLEPIGYYNEAHGFLHEEFDKDCYCQGGCSMEAVYTESQVKKLTDEKTVEKLQEELESCIQTLISVSILANGDENIVIGNFVDSRLSKLAKTHENVTKYIEKVTGKNIDVVLAENAALEAEEEE